jgi:hypothetical protein
LARAFILPAADAKRARVLGQLLQVAGAAALYGLASVDEAVEIVERLLQLLRENGEAARLEAEQRDALVMVLAGPTPSNPKPQTPNPKPQTLNSKPQTPHPKP